MNDNFLEFERPIAELEAKIVELQRVGVDADVNISEEVKKLEEKSKRLTQSIFSSLTPLQVLQTARHPDRPHGLDFIEHIFTDFDELHGDRCTTAGAALVGGLARLDGQSVVVLAHEKGRKVQEKVKRNFGMASPDDYRKSLRLMKLAERFQLPLITLIDTAGAYPGVGAEERNQSEAIARNLFEMSKLKTPIICVVIGEGGSGGALAIGVGDRVLMMEYSVYSVISPEGCASILWKSAEHAATAAEVMGITAPRIQELGLIDSIIPEPLGGAHRNIAQSAALVKKAITDNLSELQSMSVYEMLEARYRKLMSHGVH